MPAASQHFEALVVAVRGAPAGVDLAKAARLRADRDGGRIDVSGVGDRRNRRGTTRSRARLASSSRIQRKTSKSWISMSLKIPPELLMYGIGGAPGSRLVTISISGRADFAGDEPRLDRRRNVGSKRRWKPIMQVTPARATGLGAAARAVDREVDRLFAEDLLAGCGGRQDQSACVSV
jgi:hypothetical protein